MPTQERKNIFDSDSSSESGDESESELGSSAGPVAPLEGSPELLSRENLSVIRGLGLIRGRTLKNPEQFLLRRRIKLKRNPHQLALKNQKNRDLRISNLANHWNLLRFPLDEIFFRWNREKTDNIFRITIADLGIKGDEEYIDGLVGVLSIAGDVLRETRERPFDRKQYYENLTKKYNGYFRNTPDAEKPSIYKSDNYLYCWALKIWPRAVDIIRERCRR